VSRRGWQAFFRHQVACGLWKPVLCPKSGGFRAIHMAGVEMLRFVWLALICLCLVGALSVVRTTIAARAVTESASPALAEAAPAETDDAPPLAKADKLPVADSGVAKKMVTVVPIEPAPAEKIEPAPTEKKTKAPAKIEETTSWHWHEGSKIIKRTVVRER
jgi:hypothetical protein